MADVYLAKHQKLDEVAKVPKEIFLLEDEPFSYSSGSTAAKSDNTVIAVQYKPASSRLDQIAEHEAVMGRDKENLKSDWREDKQLPSKFK